MSQYSFVLPMLLPERYTIQSFPPPYNVQISPYTEVNDFSKVIRHELLHVRRKFKLRPCKVIFVGDVSVGKTTIVNRFCYDKFEGNYKATIGVDFEIESFNILGHDFNLEMWDTAGQERFKSIAQAYYRNANIVVVVFDMSNQETLHSASSWLKNALAVNTLQKPLLFLVGTKSDRLSKEEFLHAEKVAAEVAEGIKAEYWSLSARSGYKVVDFFHRIAALAFESAMKEAVIENKYFEGTIGGEMQKQSLSRYENGVKSINEIILIIFRFLQQINMQGKKLQ